jgi:hypothetical protein
LADYPDLKPTPAATGAKGGGKEAIIAAALKDPVTGEIWTDISHPQAWSRVKNPENRRMVSGFVTDRGRYVSGPEADKLTGKKNVTSQKIFGHFADEKDIQRAIAAKQTLPPPPAETGVALVPSQRKRGISAKEVRAINPVVADRVAGRLSKEENLPPAKLTEAEAEAARSVGLKIVEPPSSKNKTIDIESTPPTEGGADVGPGLGAAIPKEFDEPGSYVSNMFAAIDRDRAEMGKPPMEPTKRRTWDEDNQKALALMNRDPNWIPRLLDEVTAVPRPLLSWENAGVVWHRAKLKGEYNNALQRIAQAFDDGRVDDLSAAKSDAQIFENQLGKLDEAVGRSGTGSEAGRSLAAQKMGAGDDFSLVEMRLQKRKAKGGSPLTDKETSEVQKQFNEMQAKNAELQKHLDTRDARIAELEATKAIEQIKSDARKDPTYSPQIMAHAQRMMDSFITDDTAAINRLKAKFGDKFTGLGGATPGEFAGPGGIKLDARDIADLSIIGARELATGLTRAEWNAKMSTRLGAWIEPQLDTVFESAGKHLANEFARVEKRLGKAVTEKVRKVAAKEEPRGKRESILESISEKLEEGRKSEISFLAQKLARTFVEEGITEREALIDAVHKVFKDIDPEFTRRETMDAISGYGLFKQLSKDEISMTLRDLKGQMQQLGKLGDMASGKAPLKTGVERRSPSDIERQMIQQVNEAKKKGGFEITDPTKQLATALTARKTYYRNRLADLKQEIATRERIVKTKTTMPTDAGLETMKAEYATLKEEHAKIFGDRKLTDEQKLKMAMAGVERQIKEFDRRIKAGDFTKKVTLGIVETPELKAAKARRDALREQFNELRAQTPEFKASLVDRAIASAKSRMATQIADLTERMAKGDYQKRVRTPTDLSTDPKAMMLKGELAGIRKQFQKGLALDEARRWSPLKRAFEAGKEVIRFPRQVLAAYDLSGVLRQGGIISYSHPITAAKSIIPMLKALRSDRNALALEQQIQARPNAVGGKYSKAKLYLAQLDDFRMSAREEIMQSKFGDRFPGVRMSNRAFISFLNKLRADSFDQMLAFRERWFDKPVSDAELQLIGNYINITTGRGDMGKFSAAAEALAIPFFSPRLVLSRIQMLTGQPLRKGLLSDPTLKDTLVTRSMIAMEYSKFLGSLAVIYGLAQLAGSEDTTDPLSADFGKIKLGNTRIDPTVALGGTFVFGARYTTGKLRTAAGETMPARSSDTLITFLRNKFSPVMGAGIDARDILVGQKPPKGHPQTIGVMFPHLSREGIVGVPVPGTLFTPLSFGEIYNVMSEQGVPKGTIIEMLNILGMGVQYYEPEKSNPTNPATPERLLLKPLPLPGSRR